MKLYVRPALLPDERGTLTELLSRNLPDLDHQLRFDWIYQSNPAGRGRAWFICDGADERVIGTASLFPRSVWVDRKLETCAQVGDFAVEASHRSLGPALMLQKATLGPVQEGEFAFCYDCPPHDRGMATFQRLGLAPACRMGRLARLLRARGAIERTVPGGRLVHGPLSAVADGLLSALDAAYRPPRNLEIEPHEGVFGDEFSSFDEELVNVEADTVRARRHAAELNWRFRLDPSNVYGVLTARRSTTLRGFAIYRSAGGRARVVDIAGASDDVYPALLHGVATKAASAGASTIDLLVVSPSHEVSLARKARFFHRGNAERVVVYDAIGGSLLTKATKWKLTAADIMT